jgi:hypothetical protein
MTAEPGRALPPDAVVIRRTWAGWSAFSGDTIAGGEDGLIASSDHVGELAEYVLTLEPSEIIIQPGEARNTSREHDVTTDARSADARWQAAGTRDAWPAW